MVASLAPRVGSLAAIVVFAALLALIAYGARASDNAQPPAAPAPGTPPTVKVIIHYLGKTYDEPVPLSLVDQVITDNGLAGARIAIQDNNKSGQFLGQEYDLVEDILPADGDVVAKAKEILKDGPAIIIADLEAKDLLAVADLPEAKDSIIFNIRLSDDVLRERAMPLQRLPRRAELIDARRRARAISHLEEMAQMVRAEGRRRVRQGL